MNRSTDGKGTFRWALRSPILMGLFTMPPLDWVNLCRPYHGLDWRAVTPKTHISPAIAGQAVAIAIPAQTQKNKSLVPLLHHLIGHLMEREKSDQ